MPFFKPEYLLPAAAFLCLCRFRSLVEGHSRSSWRPFPILSGRDFQWSWRAGACWFTPPPCLQQVRLDYSEVVLKPKSFRRRSPRFRRKDSPLRFIRCDW